MQEETHHLEEEPPFYGANVIRGEEQEFINCLLKKYKDDPVDEELQKKIWDELQMEKYKGTVKIPFKVVLRRDTLKKHPDFIEIILDSKV